MFFLFDLVSSFHQITVHKDTVRLTVFCTPTGLDEWLVMPQGSSASPGWFVEDINEVIKGLGQVAAYLDDDIVFYFDLTAHVETWVRSSSVGASITSSYLPRRLATAPRMLIFWATPFRPLV